MRLIAVIAALCTVGAVIGHAQTTQGKKALYINSYHAGYAWSDGVQKSIKDTLSAAGVEVKVFLMDTYKNKSPEHLAKVSQEAKSIIDTWKPDVVLVSDDPGMKGVYAPFYKDGTLPFVFCGINWDATSYGVPSKNVTGMLEVCPIKELLSEMNKIKPGKTIGFLASEGMTPQKDLENCSKLLGVKMEFILAKDFASWKQGFQDLQSKVDLLVLGPNAGIADWNEADAVKFVEQNSKVITGSWHDFLNSLSLVAFNKLPSEQGVWAAESAIKIMKGAAPSSIPIAENKSGELVINTRIAKQLKANLSTEMLQSAKLIE